MVPSTRLYGKEPKARELTKLQKDFLNTLFSDEAKGSPYEVAKILGCNQDYAYKLVRSLKEEIIERATEILALYSPRAALTLGDVLEDGATRPGVTARLVAAQQILDRVGIVKHDKIDLNSEMPIGIFILPAKKEVIDVEFATASS